MTPSADDQTMMLADTEVPMAVDGGARTSMLRPFTTEEM